MNGPQITLIGRLTRDPGELRYTANDGTAYTRTGVAVNTYKNRGTEQETTFFNITLWGSHAENLMNRCRKGDQVYIQGGYSFREYTRAEGGKGYSHDVNARDVHYFNEPGPSQAPAETAQDSDPTWEGSPADETSRAEALVEEMPEAGNPAEEMSEAGTPVEEIPEAGAPVEEIQEAGAPAEEMPEAETPSGNGGAEAGDPFASGS